MSENNIDTYSTEFIICPYCGDENEDYYDYPNIFYEEGDHEMYCGFCDKKYNVRTETRYSYESYKKEELEE